MGGGGPYAAFAGTMEWDMAPGAPFVAPAGWPSSDSERDAGWDPDAALARMAAEMSPEQRAEAERMADVLLRRRPAAGEPSPSDDSDSAEAQAASPPPPRAAQAADARAASRLGAVAMAAAAAAASIAARTKPRPVEGPAPPPAEPDSQAEPANGETAAEPVWQARHRADAPGGAGAGAGGEPATLRAAAGGVYSAVRSLLEDGDFVAAVGGRLGLPLVANLPRGPWSSARAQKRKLARAHA
jgi:hypothetical protein